MVFYIVTKFGGGFYTAVNNQTFNGFFSLAVRDADRERIFSILPCSLCSSCGVRLEAEVGRCVLGIPTLSSEPISHSDNFLCG